MKRDFRSLSGLVFRLPPRLDRRPGAKRGQRLDNFELSLQPDPRAALYAPAVQVGPLEAGLHVAAGAAGFLDDGHSGSLRRLAARDHGRNRGRGSRCDPFAGLDGGGELRVT
jgi:hypothetical protein